MKMENVGIHETTTVQIVPNAYIHIKKQVNGTQDCDLFTQISQG